MDWRAVLVRAGGVAAFVVLALVGAFAIVELAPADRPVVAADKVLLMEGTAPLRAFNEPARSHRPEPLPSVQTTGQTSAAATLLPDPLLVQRDEPASILEPVPVQPSPLVPALPPRSVRREAPRMLVATIPPQALPEARPPLPTPAPLIRPKAGPPQPDGVLTPAAIRRLHLSLRLTREQEPFWPPVEQALLEIGTQQATMIRAGQDPKDAFGVGAAMRMYSLARPLLDSLREDQKARVRAQARSMGFTAVASQI